MKKLIGLLFLAMATQGQETDVQPDEPTFEAQALPEEQDGQLDAAARKGWVNVCCWQATPTDGYLIYYRPDGNRYHAPPIDIGSASHCRVTNLIVGKKYFFKGKVYRLNNRTCQSLDGNEVYFIAHR